MKSKGGFGFGASHGLLYSGPGFRSFIRSYQSNIEHLNPKPETRFDQPTKELEGSGLHKLQTQNPESQTLNTETNP